MIVILRLQHDQELVEGRKSAILWRDEDYAVLDGDTVIGRV
jgi:hypothetical protein